MASEKKLAFLAKKYEAAFLAAVGDGRVEPLDPDEGLEARFARIASEDPTRNGKHAEALIRWHCAGALPLSSLSPAFPPSVFAEDAWPIGTGVRADLALLERAKGRVPEDRRNPSAMAGPEELRAAALEIELVLEEKGGSGKSAAKTEAEAMAELPNARILARDGSAAVVEIRSREAAIWWGRGTRWCTAGTTGSFAERYLRDGHLYVSVSKKGVKHQWSHDTGVTDATDNRADPFDVLFESPEILQAPEALAAFLSSSKEPALRAMAPWSHRPSDKGHGGQDTPSRRRAAARSLSLPTLEDAAARGPDGAAARGIDVLEAAFDAGNLKYSDLHPSSRTLPRTLRETIGNGDGRAAEMFSLHAPAEHRLPILEAVSRPRLRMFLRDFPEIFAGDVRLAAAAAKRCPEGWLSLPPSIRLRRETIEAVLSADLSAARQVLMDAATRGPRIAAEVQALVGAIARAAVEEDPSNLLDLPEELASSLSPRLPRGGTSGAGGGWDRGPEGAAASRPEPEDGAGDAGACVHAGAGGPGSSGGVGEAAKGAGEKEKPAGKNTVGKKPAAPACGRAAVPAGLLPCVPAFFLLLDLSDTVEADVLHHPFFLAFAVLAAAFMTASAVKRSKRG